VVVVFEKLETFFRWIFLSSRFNPFPQFSTLALSFFPDLTQSCHKEGSFFPFLCRFSSMRSVLYSLRLALAF